MNRFILIFGAIILVSFASLSLAGIPKMINYQGMLTDNSGTPLNGDYSITFKIYNAESSGTKKWEETQTGVSVTNGLFNVILGSVTPIDLDFSEDYWLDITMEAEHMPSRLKFTSVGYAYRAQWSDTANYARSGGGGSGSPWVFRITDGNDTTITTGGRWGITRFGNTLYGNADSTHVNLGVACTTGIGGQNYKYCTVGGGVGNTASAPYATVGGGKNNTASDYYTTVGGGEDNTASEGWVTVAGGVSNDASGHWATIGGGACDTASGDYATVGGGSSNIASGDCATAGGGADNDASGDYATVGGGSSNIASGDWATVGGGRDNTASGYYSFASGRRARANRTGAFVWADAQPADFASTDSNQFSIRAENGVRLASSAGGSKVIKVGERYRDNGIVAWGKVTGGGTLSADLGVTSVTNDSTGAYTITLDATASDAATLIPIAQAEVESPGTIRIVSINQTSTKVFEVYINNSSFNRVNNDFVFMVTAR